MRPAGWALALALLPAAAAQAQPERWAIPHFFEIGSAVVLAPGAEPADTTRWVSEALGRQGGLCATARDPWRIFTYAEVGATPRRYALFLPRKQATSTNGQTVWEPSAEAFHFGVERSRTVGTLAGPVVRRLVRQIHPAETDANVQAIELAYTVGGTEVVLHEHKGLIPGLPVSFDRFRLDDGAGARSLVVGLIPTDTPAWVHLETFTAGGHRVVVTTDAHGESYFLAAPLAQSPRWYFGDVASDLVVEAVLRSAAASTSSARDQAAAALLFQDVAAGTLLSGRLRPTDDVAALVEQATAFLAAHDAALADLRARGTEARAFLRHYTHTFLETHRSRRDPRTLSAEPYGELVRNGADQARALLGLVSYQRKTNDLSVTEALWGLTEASMEAVTPAGGVFRSRFDGMRLAVEEDTETGRADAFIDNGGVAVSFNHRRLALRSAAPRLPGATWGAPSIVIGGRPESVESDEYLFAVDAGSIPAGDRTSLEVARLFTRRDGTVQVRETVALARGVPAARVEEVIENRGATPWSLDEVRLTIGDFLHYGDGRSEASQNRYGLSAVVEGTRQPVGLWMEGMGEPLWGDGFEPGWVDLGASYRQHRPRFLVVYAHGKAQVFHLSRPADQVLAYSAAIDGYRGWTALQVRYRVGETLAPGAAYRSPAVHSYPLRVPLFSVDADTVPDALQSLLPLWADVVEGSPDHRLAHTTLEPDDASIALQAAWMSAADRFLELAAAAPADDRRELERRARLVREEALRGAQGSLTALAALRGRADLAPAYGIGSNHGFHLLVFDWAYRHTFDPRFREAFLLLADQIATPEARGGLQVADPTKPNYGGYILHERAHAEGGSHLDDQGIKLLALRLAYERTGDPRYSRSAALFIDHWPRVRREDHQLLGVTRRFDRYLETDEATPLDQATLLVGLRAWADLHPAAARLHAEGLRRFTERHPVDAVGITGALDGGTAGNVIHFGTSTAVGGTFLLALTFDPAVLRGRWPARRGDR